MRRGVRRDRRRRELGRRRRHRRRQAAGSASRRSPASRARPGRPRSRTSVPTARRSARPSPGCAPGTASCAGSAPSPPTSARFGYRTSRFKQDPGRFVVLSTTFQFPLGDLGAPGAVRRAGRRPRHRRSASGPPRARCAKPCSTCAGARRWCSTRRTTTPGARGRSSPTRSSPADAVPEGAPTWPQPEGLVKTSAAWLIERAGFTKGYGNDRVRLSSRHTLALTNRGEATTTELLALAREIQDGVQERFGITLVNEPVLVGCEL